MTSPPATPRPEATVTKQRVVALALARRPDGAVLLVESGDLHVLPWAVVDHGEHPAAAAGRALDGAGVAGTVGDVVTGASEVAGGVHTVAVVYGVDVAHDSGPWAWPGERRVGALSAQVLGLSAGVSSGAGEPVDGAGTVAASGQTAAAPVEVLGAAGEPEPVAVPPVQRPAAYARVVDTGRVLLTRLSQWEGLWTLPGGGIDPGEHPVDALVREMHEETGLPFVPGRLLVVDSRRFTGHAPDGRLEDFHGVRFVYEGEVPLDVPPRVVEIGGSTDAAAWIPVASLATTPLTDLASRVLADLR